jgi:hypothetical protein
MSIQSVLRLTSALLLVISCFLFSPDCLAIAEDSIKPLPQLHKEFLIVVHIVKDKQGAPGVDTTLLKSVIQQANAAFQPISASFRICEFRYIDNFQYDTLPAAYRPELLSKYNVNNRINMYFVSAMINLGPHCGNADLGGVATPSNAALVILKGACISAITIAHEFGHYFSLLHTFQGSGAELVNGANCTTAGDGICDTPADPYSYNIPMSSFIDPNCVFIGTQKDANGNYYDPDVSNLMSYYGQCICLKFTTQQYIRMAEYYMNNKVAW